MEIHQDPYFPGASRSRIDFLVYGECVCGWHCACPEGALWPACPACGEEVRPRRMFGPTQRPCGHGYVAELLLETEAVKKAIDRGYLPPRTMWGRLYDPGLPVFEKKAPSADMAAVES